MLAAARAQAAAHRPASRPRQQAPIALGPEDGTTLRRVLATSRARPPSVSAVLWIATGVAERLTELHSKGAVFRRLAPSTVVLSGAGVVGLASGPALADESAFVAPEARVGVVGDHRLDLFALGTIVVALLTGETVANPDPTYLAGLQSMIEDEHPDARAVVANLFDLLGALIAVEPARRPLDAISVAASFRFVYDTLGGWPDRCRELEGLIAKPRMSSIGLIGGRPASNPAMAASSAAYAAPAEIAADVDDFDITVDDDALLEAPTQTSALQALTGNVGLASEPAPPPVRDGSIFTFVGMQGTTAGSTPLVLRDWPVVLDPPVEQTRAAILDIEFADGGLEALAPLTENELMAPPSILPHEANVIQGPWSAAPRPTIEALPPLDLTEDTEAATVSDSPADLELTTLIRAPSDRRHRLMLAGLIIAVFAVGFATALLVTGA